MISLQCSVRESRLVLMQHLFDPTGWSNWLILLVDQLSSIDTKPKMLIQLVGPIVEWIFTWFSILIQLLINWLIEQLNFESGIESLWPYSNGNHSEQGLYILWFHSLKLDQKTSDNMKIIDIDMYNFRRVSDQISVSRKCPRSGMFQTQASNYSVSPVWVHSSWTKGMLWIRSKYVPQGWVDKCSNL